MRRIGAGVIPCLHRQRNVVERLVSYSHVRASTEGREKEIETAFVADQDKTDLSDWLYNGSTTARWKSRAISLLGWLSHHQKPTTRVPPTSAAPCGKFWR
jgi:hypothetical protein